MSCREANRKGLNYNGFRRRFAGRCAAAAIARVGDVRCAGVIAKLGVLANWLILFADGGARARAGAFFLPGIERR
jgi:hypothetical protein